MILENLLKINANENFIKEFNNILKYINYHQKNYNQKIIIKNIKDKY